MYKVIDKQYGESKTFSTAREVGIYLLGRDLANYFILKQVNETIDLSGLEGYSHNEIIDYIEEY